MAINIDIFSILLGAIIGIIIEKILLVIVGPEIEYEISYRWNWFLKRIREAKIEVSFFRVSNELTDTVKVSEVQEKIITLLSENQIGFQKIGTDLEISNFEFGTSKYIVFMRFVYDNFKKGTLSSINLEIPKNCDFNKFSEEIIGIDNCSNKVLEIIKTALPNYTNFRPVIKCKIKKIEKVVGVLAKLNKISKDNLFNYMYFSNRLKVEISSESIMLSDEIDATGIQLLKEFIIMYY